MGGTRAGVGASGWWKGGGGDTTGSTCNDDSQWLHAHTANVFGSLSHCSIALKVKN